MARRDIQLFKFDVWDEEKGMFFDRFEAYADTGDQASRVQNQVKVVPDVSSSRRP